jgi:tRNA threonylcarbamoyladenosine biosynthesis protein TsaE
LAAHILAAELLLDATDALIGTLGAGKTRLVQAFAAAQGVAREEATSPTFCPGERVSRQTADLSHRRVGTGRRRRVYRAWAGPREYFESHGVTFIEWADRVAEFLPAEVLEIRCEAVGETQRRFEVTATTERLERCIERVRAAVL